jgi:predicted adenine nucleotide alpha hydrolase (AANH) superfamily ATPase
MADTAFHCFAEKTRAGRPALLLHACCAPCSSAVIERLAASYDITLFFYNPNIYPATEYVRRISELRNFASAFAVDANPPDINPPARKRGFPVVEAAYEPEVFYRETRAREETELQTERERGERCRRCYRFRLRAAFEYAAKHGFGVVTTTLSLSPYKDAGAINAAGMELARLFAQRGAPDTVDFLCADFKKRDGYKRSLELSKKYGLYRQSYCGCEYSLYNRKHERCAGQG